MLARCHSSLGLFISYIIDMQQIRFLKIFPLFFNLVFDLLDLVFEPVELVRKSSACFMEGNYAVRMVQGFSQSSVFPQKSVSPFPQALDLSPLVS